MWRKVIPSPLFRLQSLPEPPKQAYQWREQIQTARGGEGGTDRGERESTVCSDVFDERAMGGTGFVRRTLLCARGQGEPHQGAVQFVCRWGECGDDAGQPDAAVSVGHGLRPG